MTKDELLSDVLSKTLTQTNVLFQIPMSTGKTNIALTWMKENNIINVLIVTPETNHFASWKNDIKKFHKKNRFNIIYSTYSSLKKHIDKVYDCIVLDECHRLTTNSYPIVKQIKSDRFIALTGTLTPNKQAFLLQCRPNIHRYLLSLDEALKLELIRESFIYLIPLELDKINKIHPHKYKKDGVQILLTEFEKNEAYVNSINYYKQNRSEFSIFMMNKLGSERKRFLSSIKTYKIKTLLEDLKAQNQRVICFTGSIDQALKIDSKTAIHSDNSKDYNESLINSFQKKKVNSLVAVNTLTEGHNFKDLDCVIIGQLDGSTIKPYQKLGRALRAEIPKTYVFYYPNTQDQKYLNNFLENLQNCKIITL